MDHALQSTMTPEIVSILYQAYWTEKFKWEHSFRLKIINGLFTLFFHRNYEKFGNTYSTPE